MPSSRVQASFASISFAYVAFPIELVEGSAEICVTAFRVIVYYVEVYIQALLVNIVIVQHVGRVV